MLDHILREIIPLTNEDCFTIFSRKKKTFDFPLHNHEEIELNFIYNAEGAKRIVGDHIGNIGEYELVMIGSNLPHVWENNSCKSNDITEITIQFHKDFLDEKFLRRNQMSQIRNMFSLSAKGILFSQETTMAILPRLNELSNKHGFDSVLELLSILHDLSASRNMQTLSNNTFSNNPISYNSRRIDNVMEYINQHFSKEITLSEVAKKVNMAPVSFSRFFKARTGITFMDCLLEARLGPASRMLIDTTHTIAEIAYKCGFNNISNFNRLFKKKKGCTPKEYREDFSFYGNRRFI